MKTQARRATLLTILAVIYLPLTLVTGVFGMNLKEINDGAPRFWACIAGLAIIGGATAVGILGYRLWRHRRDARLLREQREDKVYKLA
jgi:Mg2+ and Co2+ transporter CorA